MEIAGCAKGSDISVIVNCSSLPSLLDDIYQEA